MDAITFADVLFTIVVLAVTFGILFLVNKARDKKTTIRSQESTASDKCSEDASS